MNCPIWFCLTLKRQEELQKYQKRWFRKKLDVPPLSFKPISAELQMENSEEIDKLMRKPPASKRSLIKFGMVKNG